MAACKPEDYGFDVTFIWEDEKSEISQTTEENSVQNAKEINRDDITCAICLLVLREPVQAVKCGHRFCEKCIGEFHLQNPGKCPKDWQEIQVFPDVGKKREILSLKIRCPNFVDGCTWQNELREKEVHLKTCGFVTVPCELDCGEFVLRKNITNHVDTVCPMISSCEYKDSGCYFKGTKLQLDNHMAQSANMHLSLEMKSEIFKMKKEFDQRLTAKGLEAQQMKNEFAEQLKMRDNEIGKVRLDLDRDLKAKDKMNQALAERLKIAEEKLKGVEEMEIKVQMNQTAIKSLEKKLLTKLKTTDKSLFDLKEEFMLTKQEVEKVKERNQKDDLIKASGRAVKEELNLAICAPSLCNYTWTIENFKGKFDTAWKLTRYDSPMFFTKHGYKGFIFSSFRETNRDNKNTYVSVFFKNEEGPHDDTLEWPMPWKSLTFTLILNGVEIAQTVRRSTDEGGRWKDSFKRPLAYTSFYVGNPSAFEHGLFKDITMNDSVAIRFVMN
ncbi:TNF receptor-associated factor 3-like isoform X1 [Clytia hemisphaerica]|uniref:TNF receptor-associated factor 3-like isoform X1 n=1 Tax=Clytia hemisphaerica TaxID=252671 RepID=UPI0034D665B4